jgi:hypothetical protein
LENKLIKELTTKNHKQMKKLFLLIAFTGIVGASSALSVSALTKGTVITLGGEEKKEEKKKCDKDKACCKKGESAKACSGEKAEGKSCSKGEGKSCCKAKAHSEAPAVAPEKK